MKILYHHCTLADGAEGVHIAAMVDAFGSLGHDVHLVGLTSKPDHASRRRMVERARASIPAVAYEAATVAYNLPEYVKILGELRRFRPDLLYTRHSRAGVAALIAARRLRVPSVLEVNALFADPDYLQFEPLVLARVVRALERRAAEMATVVVAVSSPLGTRLRALANANVVVLPNGADPDKFNPDLNGLAIRSRFGLTGRLTIGWAGILRQWHGVELLLDALARVPAATLLIVGDGPARSDLELRARAMAIGDRVVITGRVLHDEMPAYIAAMDIGVVVNERTGVASPMKLLEYMAMGRAVVAPRTENIEDVVRDGVNGMLFRPDDPRDLAAKLQTLAADEGLRERLGANARADITAARNWRSIAEGVLSAVEAARLDS